MTSDKKGSFLPRFLLPATTPSPARTRLPLDPHVGRFEPLTFCRAICAGWPFSPLSFLFLDEAVRMLAPAEAVEETGRTLFAVSSRRCVLGLPDGRANWAAEEDQPVRTPEPAQVVEISEQRPQGPVVRLRPQREVSKQCRTAFRHYESSE